MNELSPGAFGPPVILSVDGAVWVVCKPAGWLVHPAGEACAPDLIDHLVSIRGAPRSIAPVHRLDVDTSGIVLYATTSTARAELGRLFVEGLVEKKYVAIVHGRTRAKGIIRRALDDGRRGRPLEAVTRYRAREHLGGFTYVALRPEHGRKHQLRRHLAGVGHPIIGDLRYGAPSHIRIPAYPHRVWLHAESLSLPDGRTFRAPLTDELAASLDALRAGARAGVPDDVT